MDLRTIWILMTVFVASAVLLCEWAKAEPRVAVIAAMETERVPLIERMAVERTEKLHGTELVFGTLGGMPVIVFSVGVGMTNAAMRTQMVLGRHRIRQIVVSGIAGAADEGLSVGDVVVPRRWGTYSTMIFARRTGDGTYKLPVWFEPKVAPFDFIYPMGIRAGADNDRHLWFDLDTDLAARAHALAQVVTLTPCTVTAACARRRPRIVTGGSGVSGPVFVDHDGFRTYLRDAFEAQVIDMETTAIARVAMMHDIPMIAFRGISDFAGAESAENVMPVYLDLAANNAADATQAFLKAQHKM